VRTEKSYIEDLMYGRRTSFFVGCFLRLLSLLYGLALRLRHLFYVRALFRQEKLEQRVISVGNITLGGTGKTPTVMQIAGMLLNHQLRPVVISRGYGRSTESDLVVVSDGRGVLVDAKTGGDEPVLIGSKLTGVPVVVDGNRCRAARYAQRAFGTDTVILDDGFQHLRLRRDLDIVLIDAADPFGSGKLFPAGILREPLSALERAHAVLITGADRGGDLGSLKGVIRRHTRAKIFTSRLAPADLIDITTGETRPISTLRDTGVLAFAGIARPDAFVSTLRALGAKVVAQVAYPDHYAYKKSDLEALVRRAAEDKPGMILTTEKDAVRLRSFQPRGIWALRVELKVVENDEWEAVLLSKL
jgi:tetraacyldisaccharide 4'-kinase